MKVLKEADKSFHIKKGKCTKCDYRESLAESKTTKENFSEITALADDCGKNTFKVSARDIRFTFENEDNKTKFVNKLLSSNIPHIELPFGIISINKSDALDESRSIKEEFIDHATYPYMYISNTGDEYVDMNMSDEDIDKAYETGRFSDEMWLKSEAWITKEGDQYQVSWGDFDDYVECDTIKECKKVVQEYYPYGFRWLRIRTNKPSEAEKRISKKLSKVKKDIDSVLDNFVDIRGLTAALRQAANDNQSFHLATYMGLHDRGSETLIPYMIESNSIDVPHIGILIYHGQNKQIPEHVINSIHDIFYRYARSPRYFKYRGIDKRLGSDALIYQLYLPDDEVDKINNNALAKHGLQLVDNNIVEIGSKNDFMNGEHINKVNEDKFTNKSKSTRESITHSPLSTADPIAHAVKLLYEMNKFVLDVYDSENWLMNGVPDGEFQETTAEEAMNNYAEHDWLITDFESNFSTEDFKDFLATFKSCTRSKSYNQAERARIIAEAENLLKEYLDKIDKDADEDHAFSKEKVIAQLKQELPNLGDSGTIKYGYKSEAEAAVDFLEEIYAIVELDKVGSWFQINYAELFED